MRRAAVDFLLRFSPVLTFSSMAGSSSSLHAAYEDGVDGKYIFGELVFIRSRFVEENHEFCSIKGEYM
jgi:hypothetical protein